MPNWSNRPPKDPRGTALPIIRTPAGRPLVAIVTSESLLGCATHWYKGRTVPCSAPSCDACLDGFSWRWHGYVGVFNFETHKHYILELTAQACDPLVAYQDHYGTLRGCLIEATRVPKKFNGRVTIRCKPGDLEKHKLPPAPNLENSLAVLWNLPLPEVEIDSRAPNPDTNRFSDSTEDSKDPEQLMSGLSFKGNSPAKTSN